MALHTVYILMSAVANNSWRSLVNYNNMTGLSPLSPLLGHIWDVTLVRRKGNINENVSVLRGRFFCKVSKLNYPSEIWYCWLGHLTRKIVPEMTYNVSSGTLNPTTPYWQASRTSKLIKGQSEIAQQMLQWQAAQVALLLQRGRAMLRVCQ